MKIHNLSNLPLIDYREAQPLQGDLKDLSEDNHDKLLRVLEKRGFTTPLFVWFDGQTNWLLDGHQRHRVMVKNDLSEGGDYKVPYVLIPAKDEKEAKEQLLEITSQYGRITQEGFDEFAADLEIEELDIHFDALPDLSFDLVEDEEVEEDEAPEVDDKNPPVSKLGEIYQLGRHRLMCGDSTDFGLVSDLLNGTKPDLLFTDPPYNVAFNGRSGNFDVIENDDLKPEDFENFISQVADIIQTLEVPAYYIWCNWKFYGVLQRLLPFKTCIVWAKNVFGLGTGYRHQHEFCLFNGSIDSGINNESDLWEVAKDSNYQHPTQKPVALAVRALDNHKGAKNVLDLFGGSGFTIVGCEQRGRTSYTMELDPKYCDVIRKRYAKLIDKEDLWQEATPIVNSENSKVA